MKSPKKVRPRFQMGYYYYNLGDCEIASQNFSIAAELGPPSAALLVNWGASQICAGRPKQALRILEDAAKLVPNFDLVHVYRGDAYVKLGDGVHAAEAYQRALAINPGSTLAKESLRRIEEKSRPR